MTWDAILFDFDGVLADTEPIHYECWRDLLQPFGIEMDWDYYQKQCIGVADALMVERLAAARTPPIPLDAIRPLYSRKKEIFRARLEATPPFLPETIELIQQLSKLYVLAVVSSSGRSEIEPPLERAGIRHHFQTLVCGKEVLNLKPAPDPYLRAAALLGARNPLVVEDSDSGVASGLAAGFEVLRVSLPERVADEVRAHLLAAGQDSR